MYVFKIRLVMWYDLFQVDDGLVLPGKASLYLTAIEDAEYKHEKIECELYGFVFDLFLSLS